MPIITGSPSQTALNNNPTPTSLAAVATFVWNPGTLQWVMATQAGGGGGGAVTIADGADVAQGATTDAAVTGDNPGTLSAKLRGLNKILADVWDSANHWLRVQVQGTVTVTGPLTDTQLRATPVPVSGPLTDTQLRATPVPISGTVTANQGTAGATPWLVTPTVTQVVSGVNSTTTPLGAGATFTGTSVDVSIYATVQVLVASDRNSATNGLQIQFSSDNVNWDDSCSISYTTGTSPSLGVLLTTAAKARFMRVVYVNGGSAQAFFRLTTYLNGYNVSGDTIDIGVPISDFLHAFVTKSLITGKTTGGGGGYVDVKVNPSGALTVDASGSSVTATVSGTVTANQGGAPWSQNITQVGGVALTLGQKAMAASVPVAIASDQSAVPENLTQIGGAAFALGQRTAAQSISVVNASDDDSVLASTLSQTGTGAANTALTVTLPAAGAGLFHYITHIHIKRVCTAALAGGVILTVTTTNLGGRSWRTGNVASITTAAGDNPVLIDSDFAHPLKSAVANTATTIVCPAPGLAVSWQVVVDYFTGT